MAVASVRTAHIGAALESYRSLHERLPTLSLAEVERAIDVELATKRRRSVLNKLVDAATKKYHADLMCKVTKNQPKE